ncbi:MAG: zf-HC2 domain-containing protein [Actinomycetota bacterium]|nr:zf-HC2 domain-containing protein [Actinomycetota bacterium]
MRCRKALKLLNQYFDGELTPFEVDRLEQHLASCEDCAGRLDLLRGMTSALSSLNPIEPTPEESRRLMQRVSAEMAGIKVERPVFRRASLAVAASVITVAAVVGITFTLVSGGEAPQDLAMEENQAPKDLTLEMEEAEEHAASGRTGEATSYNLASATRPSLDVTGTSYTLDELEGYRNDLGTRLDFYSTYWYPATDAAAASTAEEELEPLQRELVEDLVLQAEENGRDPVEVENAVDAALAREDGETLLPCHVELANLDGQEVWLVSLSGPEDYLLFNDPQAPSSMHLASMGGEEGLEISEALLKELARKLIPYPDGTTVSEAREETTPEYRETPDCTEVDKDAQVQPEAGAAGEEEGITQYDSDQDFHAFLRRLAAQGNDPDLLEELKGLDYDQLFLLLQGNWKALTGENIDLSDLLVPPKNLCAVDVQSFQVVWAE